MFKNRFDCHSIFHFLCFFLLAQTLVGSVKVPAAAPSIRALENGWYEVKPGGESICARGGEFSFFYYKGRTDKIVIDFIGGGACWNEETCKEKSTTFYDSIDDLRRRVERGLEGVYDHSNPQNPIGLWSHVVVPYCTGDIHWGDSVVKYGTGDEAFTIHHKGAANAKAVIKWTQENLSAPEQIFVTGCSAGSYGSIYWTPLIQETFPRAKLFQLGDAGAGVVTDDFFKNHFSKWNPEKNSPSWIPNLDPAKVDWYSLKVTDLYREVGKYYPNIHLSQFHSALDSTQVFFYELMGGGGEEEWSQQMFSYMNLISQENPHFNYYISQGQNHCIIPYDNFYYLKTEGVKFLDWVNRYLDGEKMSNVSCVNCDTN